MGRRLAMDYLRALEDLLGHIEGYQINADNTEVTVNVGRVSPRDRGWMVNMALALDWKQVNPGPFFGDDPPERVEEFLCMKRGCETEISDNAQGS